MSNGPDNQLTRNYALPAWMVWGFIALFTTASGTIGGVVVVDRQQMHSNTAEIGFLKERIGRVEEKTKDILDALNSIRSDLKEMLRRTP